MNGFNLKEIVNCGKPQIQMYRFYCQLSQSYKYRLFEEGKNSETTDFWGELRQGYNGEWNWFYRGSIKVIGKGEGSFKECVAQIEAF